MKIETNFDYELLGEGADRLGELFLMVKAVEPEIELHLVECDKTNNKEDSIVFKLPNVMAAPTIKVSVLREGIESQGVTATSDWIVGLLREECPLNEAYLEEMASKDYILKNVTIRLVNAGRNRHYMQDYVCREWLDLLQILQVKVFSVGAVTGIGAFCLTKAHAEMLGFSEDELFDAALKNSCQDITVMSMRELLCSYMGDDAPEGLFDMDDDAEELMYVISNEDKHYGACMMLHLDKVAKELGLNEFYVLPSSVHEVIVCTEGEPEYLREMVGEVNADHVADEDFLSKNIYHYCNGELTIA